jgi:hypothetical protein
MEHTHSLEGISFSACQEIQACYGTNNGPAVAQWVKCYAESSRFLHYLKNAKIDH